MYRILKQWRTIGSKEIEIKAFRELLDIPKTYNISSINRAVIGPIKKELPEYFKDLKIKTIKANTQGTPVIAYKFTWIPEQTSSWDPNKFNNKIPSSKKTRKKKPYRSKNGSIEAKEFAERAREERFKRMLELRKEEEGENEI